MGSWLRIAGTMARLLLLASVAVSWSFVQCQDKPLNHAYWTGAPKTLEIGPGIYTFSPHDIYISMFIVTGDGVIAIEPVSVSHSQEMIKAIQKVTDEPIKYIIHTHDHWDHSKGNGEFRKIGATVLAHQEACEWMEANTHADMVTPDQCWKGDKSQLSLGNTTLNLHYMGINHGNGMTIVEVPEQRLILVADLVVPERVLLAFPDFNVPEWERTLEEILELDFDKVVCVHNNHENALEPSSKEDVRLQLQMFTDLRNALHEELAKGGNPFEAPGKVKMPKYENYGGYKKWLEFSIWRMFLDEHMGPYPWRKLEKSNEVDTGATSLKPEHQGLMYYLPTSWVRNFFGYPSAQHHMMYHG